MGTKFETFAVGIFELSKISSRTNNDMSGDNSETPSAEANNATTFDEFVETLTQFDVEGKGTVKAAELRHILTVLGNPLSEDEVDQVFAGQINSDGQINIVQFVRHVLEA
ncbi:EF hand [Aphelenchoides bicaudatus]|nr:EF hand [Aphelenchoides bicaudatus]